MLCQFTEYFYQELKKATEENDLDSVAMTYLDFFQEARNAHALRLHLAHMNVDRSYRGDIPELDRESSARFEVVRRIMESKRNIPNCRLASCAKPAQSLRVVIARLRCAARADIAKVNEALIDEDPKYFYLPAILQAIADRPAKYLNDVQVRLCTLKKARAL
jgi:hypothetical protein